MLDYIEAIKDLTDSEKVMFQSEIKDKSKSVFVGQMACLFLGGFGGHRFYLGQSMIGLFYFLGIPTLFIISLMKDWQILTGFIVFFYLIGLLVEVLRMRSRVLRYNQSLALDISKKIKSIRPKKQADHQVNPVQ